MSMPPQEPPGLRISDDDREQAARRLQQAMAEGRITIGELEERLSAVYAARYSYELRPPLADLPPLIPAIGTGPVTVLRAGVAEIKRTGAWSVPPRLRVQNLLGSVLLDFTKAENSHPVVEIELRITAGSVKLLVPDDATADVDQLVTALGGISCRVPTQRRPEAPHFVVRGRCGLSSVLIRRRLWVARHFT